MTHLTRNTLTRILRRPKSPEFRNTVEPFNLGTDIKIQLLKLSERDYKVLRALHQTLEAEMDPHIGTSLNKLAKQLSGNQAPTSKELHDIFNLDALHLKITTHNQSNFADFYKTNRVPFPDTEVSEEHGKLTHVVQLKVLAMNGFDHTIINLLNEPIPLAIHPIFEKLQVIRSNFLRNPPPLLIWDILCDDSTSDNSANPAFFNKALKKIPEFKQLINQIELDTAVNKLYPNSAE